MPIKLTTLIPGFIVALLTLMAAAPWGLEASGRFLLPLLPFLAIAHFTALQPNSMPGGLVFGSGLCLDVLTHGPLGYWSFVFLAGYLLMQWLAVTPPPSLLQRWLAFAVVMACVVAVEWSISSLFFIQPADWRPLLSAGLGAIALFPVAALALQPLHKIGALAGRLNLERGG